MTQPRFQWGRPESWRHWLGLSLLLIQLAAIGYARFSPLRFFCWAPYDEHTRYTIMVKIDGQPLSGEQVAARYRYDDDGWEVRSIHNVFSLVSQYEDSYGRQDHAEVTIHYNLNGRSESVWKWPAQ